MATTRTKEERLHSLNSRLARLLEKRREADHRRDTATTNYRAAKEAAALADRGYPPPGYNPRAQQTNRIIMQAAMDECDYLDRKMTELRQRIADVTNGDA